MHTDYCSVCTHTHTHYCTGPKTNKFCGGHFLRVGTPVWDQGTSGDREGWTPLFAPRSGARKIAKSMKTLANVLLNQ